MITTNVPMVIKSLNNISREIDVRALQTRNELTRLFLFLAKSEIKGSRKKAGYPAIPGKPPMNLTGTLRRSIVARKYQKGFADYRSIVGPTVVYARALELGGRYAPPSWRGTKAQEDGFPFMKPAFDKFAPRARTIIRKNYGV